MPTSRRSLLAATGAASLASLSSSLQAQPGSDSSMAGTVGELVRRSADGHAALMRGDLNGYRASISLSDDFTLMSPFGGAPTHAADLTEARWEEVARFFRNGSLVQELVRSYVSADMVVLAVIEHCHGEVGGLPAQQWPLRVTLVYRRDGDQWRLAHRHADALAKGISLERAAELAR